jgi:hypothetical protein
MVRTIAMIAVAASTLPACVAESEIEPRTPVNAQLVAHEKMKNPDIRDGFMQVAQPSYATSPPPPPPRRTVSLGFIGDEPVGMYAPPPEPTWARPFPCHWTRTCGYVAPRYDPYAVYPRRYYDP